MNLLPADLGERFERLALDKRVWIKNAIRPATWIGAIGGALFLSSVTGNFHLGVPIDMALGVAGAGAGAAAGWIGIPRALRRRWRETPVTDSELAALETPLVRLPPLPTQIFALLLGREISLPTRDTLEDAFLRLAREMRALEVSDTETEQGLRETLRSLGDAVSALPEPPTVSQEGDIREIIVDAEVLLARSRREGDPVVRESLQRQAEAAATRARGLTEALRIARRTRVLREEVRAQIEAFRAALPALSRPSGAVGALGTGRFNQLADQVRGVAREAASVAAAQEELAQALRVPAAEAPAIQRLGR